MDQFKGIPSVENVHESTEAHGGVEPTNPLVQLDPGLFAVSYTHLTLPTNREV